MSIIQIIHPPILIPRRLGPGLSAAQRVIHPGNSAKVLRQIARRADHAPVVVVRDEDLAAGGDGAAGDLERRGAVVAAGGDDALLAEGGDDGRRGEEGQG